MTTLIKFLKSAWKWVLENPWAIVVSIIGVFLAVKIVKSKNNKIASLQDAVAVQATLKQIAADEAKAEMIMKRAEERNQEVIDLEKKISASKRRVVEIHEGKPLSGKTDDEIANLFSSSGL